MVNVSAVEFVKIKNDDLKIGDIVYMKNDTEKQCVVRSFTGSDKQYAHMMSEKLGFTDWVAEKRDDGFWGADYKNGNLYRIKEDKDDKTSNKEKKILVRGYEPKAVISIGCVSVPYDKAWKLAKRMRRMIVLGGKDEFTVRYKEHGLTLEEIDNFILWMKKNKVNRG